MNNTLKILLLALFMCSQLSLRASENQEFISAAVLDFSVSADESPELGKEVATLVAVSLTLEGDIVMVERAELEKILSEQQLGLSGAVNASTAAKIGELTGAKVLVTGRVINIGDTQIIVAKVIGTETSRVYATKVTVKSAAEVNEAVDELGSQVAELVRNKRVDLLGPEPDLEQLYAKLKPLLVGKDLPAVSVTIPEVHIGTNVPDPAAQTEIVMLLHKLGFGVYPEGDSRVDVQIKGEAFSEFAGRYTGLYSCRARVEIEMEQLDSGKLLWADRENAIGLDLAERFASKKALQKAGYELSERVVRKLIGE